MTVFNISMDKQDHLKKKMFFDEPVDIARYDAVKYPQFRKLRQKQKGFEWKPEEIELYQDGNQFKLLSPHEEHIFTSNIKRQILLDSVQGRAPTAAFGPICSLPEVEAFISCWSEFEFVHSESYSYLIRNVYPDPSKVFDEMLNIPEIVDCAKDISKYYDELIELNKFMGDPKYDQFNMLPTHKEALWMCLNAVNALEGIRFYVSFACSWAFAELRKMEGNAKIIKLICRDENVHLAFTQQVIKLLPKDDPDFAAIRTKCVPEVLKLIDDVVQQEKAWAKYLCKDGSIIGLNEKILCKYIEWIADKRLVALGYSKMYDSKNNPLPWTQKWIGGAEVQPAPQEGEITSYISGGVTQDVDVSALKEFVL